MAEIPAGCSGHVRPVALLVLLILGLMVVAEAGDLLFEAMIVEAGGLIQVVNHRPRTRHELVVGHGTGCW